MARDKAHGTKHRESFSSPKLKIDNGGEGLAPITAFTQFPAENPVLYLDPQSDEAAESRNLEKVKASQLMQYDTVAEAIPKNEFHSQRQCQRTAPRCNRSTQQGD